MLFEGKEQDLKSPLSFNQTLDLLTAEGLVEVPISLFLFLSFFNGIPLHLGDTFGEDGYLSLPKVL